MNPAPVNRLSHASLQQAANWYVQLQDAAVSDEQRRHWQAWIDQAAEHRQAWGYVQRVSQRLLPLQEAGAQQAASQALRAERRKPLARRQVLGGLLLMGLGWGTWRNTALPQALERWRADYATGTGEIRDTRLSDGTHLWLNALTALDVRYSALQRLLWLHQGEILIDTAQDPQRPFRVATEHGRLQALGTRFSVRREAQRSLLNVYAGAVQVQSANGAQVQVVQAGQQLAFDAAGLGPLLGASAAREAWSRGLLLADNLPLAQLLEELGRYRPGHLGCDPAIGQLPVMGSFPLHDSDQALALLEAALPVRVERLASWWVTLEPRG
ncbi:FecR domain-containing protein [Pseudomonas sp. NFXW11]|uniref:FecR domain-containing protein n=1 Tax=Pseudomonas sp. NFXW11 TaxID=2819531 RepID=UPI003CF899B9